MQPNLVESLLMILEKPNAKKGYKDLKKYLEFIGKKHEAQAIDLLLQKKFHEINNPDSNQEQ